jgi:hypothetical protein
MKNVAARLRRTVERRLGGSSASSAEVTELRQSVERLEQRLSQPVASHNGDSRFENPTLAEIKQAAAEGVAEATSGVQTALDAQLDFKKMLEPYWKTIQQFDQSAQLYIQYPGNERLLRATGPEWAAALLAQGTDVPQAFIVKTIPTTQRTVESGGSNSSYSEVSGWAARSSNGVHNGGTERRASGNSHREGATTIGYHAAKVTNISLLDGMKGGWLGQGFEAPSLDARGGTLPVGSYSFQSNYQSRTYTKNGFFSQVKEASHSDNYRNEYSGRF